MKSDGMRPRGDLRLPGARPPEVCEEPAMADLSRLEKHKLEKLFDMASGYVLGHSNRTLSELVLDTVGLDIYDEKYARGSGSKAHRLRAFWDTEPNAIVGAVLDALLAERAFVRDGAPDPEGSLTAECQNIVARLRGRSSIEDAAVFKPITSGEAFEMLASEVNLAIQRHALREGLDRLHGFVVSYMRALCERHGAVVTRDTPLHSLVGLYAKAAREKGLIQSEMTDRIVRSSISVMEKFNDVRNDQSLAHPNTVLNFDEALLIYRHVAATIRFLGTLERSSPGGVAGDPET
jgi:hypothetical protein